MVFPFNWKMVLAGTLLLATIGAAGLAQELPGAGQNRQVPPRPENRSDRTIVLNPTQDQCQQGWDASLRWTAEQFKALCDTLEKSK